MRRMATEPSHFFHYTTREAAFEHIIPRRTLRFSPYGQMRDPLENKRWGFPESLHGLTETERELETRAWFSFHRHANEIRSSAKLLSLTLDADYGDDPDAEHFAHGWARARMWEQYAERHAGVCLVFSGPRLAAAVRESLCSKGIAPPYHRHVVYSAAAFQPLLRLHELSEADDAAVVRKWVQANSGDLFFRKTPDWQTEYEYRFVVTYPDSTYVCAAFGGALEMVVVGERFPTWQRSGAAELCDRAGARLLQLRWESGFPVPVPLNV
jgi:Protein of unknown function (DUF2971)